MVGQLACGKDRDSPQFGCSPQRTVGLDPTSYPLQCSDNIKNAEVGGIKDLLTAPLGCLYNLLNSLFHSVLCDIVLSLVHSSQRL
jgi:hypothetical protein